MILAAYGSVRGGGFEMYALGFRKVKHGWSQSHHVGFSVKQCKASREPLPFPIPFLSIYDKCTSIFFYMWSRGSWAATGKVVRLFVISEPTHLDSIALRLQYG